MQRNDVAGAQQRIQRDGRITLRLDGTRRLEWIEDLKLAVKRREACADLAADAPEAGDSHSLFTERSERCRWQSARCLVDMHSFGYGDHLPRQCQNEGQCLVG